MMRSHEQFRWRGQQIPLCIYEGLVRYVEDHCPTGSCLQAILENDLKEAFARADEDVGDAMWAIVAYLYNEVPSCCYGSKQKVAEWLAARGEAEA